MLYAIIILSILVVILLLCIGVLLYGMKNNKKTLDGILGNDDVTEEEIISMVREGHEQGTILASEAELIHNVFEFDDKEVKDIMTHRKNIVSLDGSMSFIDAIEFIIDTGKSRFPVYENDVDSIIGVLHIKDAFTFFEKNEVYRSSIKDIDVLKVAEYMNIDVTSTKCVSIPDVPKIKSCGVLQDKPYEYVGVRTVFEEAFK